MNVLERFYAMKPYIQGKKWEEVFPQEFSENLNYRPIRAGCCIICYHPMNSDDMFPRDRLTPRAICPTCWSTITSRITQFCWICSMMLDLDVIHAQQQDLSNLHHRIHTGKCADYFSAVSAVALGEHTGLVMSRQQPTLTHHPAQRAIAYNPQPTVDDIINMVPTNQREFVPVQRRKPLPVANKTFKKNYR